MDAKLKLTQFMDAVNRSTDAEIAQKKEAAEQQAQQLLQTAQAQCAKESERALAEAKAKLSAKYQKQMSQAGYQGKTAFLSKRQALLMQLFAELREKLIAFTASADYAPWLEKLLAAQQPEAGAVILLREKDLDLQARLAESVDAACTFRADRSIVLGGLSVLSADGRRCFNHTLDEAYQAQLRNFYRNHNIDGGNE